MKNFILSLVLLTLPNISLSKEKVGLQEFRDIKRLEKRDDGLYNIICMDGTIEIGKSYEDIVGDRVCNALLPKLDLLLVIDDSDSVDEIQKHFSEKIDTLVHELQGLDFQISTATTSDSCLRKTSSGKRIFTYRDFELYPESSLAGLTELIDVPVKSSFERGILMATDSLLGICGATTEKWTRDNVFKLVILVTDEENCGSASSEGCEGEPWEVASYFTEKFRYNANFSALVLLEDPAMDNERCPYSGYWEDLPNPINYIDLVNQTGGIYEDVCKVDFDHFFKNVVDTVKLQVSRYER